MRPRAFVIKYMPDLRRREPRNVGVVVTDGSRVLSRFVGEDDDGELRPLNTLPRSLFGSLKTYRSWWKPWHRVVQGGDADPDSLGRLLVPDVASNYVCEVAMVEMAGRRATLDEFLDEAWMTLVHTSAEEAAEDDEESLRTISDRLISPFRQRRGYQVWAEKALSVDHRDRHGQPFEARLHFHYMIRNGKWSHVRRVKLSAGDVTTWNRVHLTVRHFEGLQESVDAAHRDSTKIVLVQAVGENDEAERQLQELERKTIQVVEVEDSRAPDLLEELIIAGHQ